MATGGRGTEKAAEEVLGRHDRDLLALPHVTGAGIGEDDGVADGERFFIRVYGDSDEAAAGLPGQLEGLEVQFQMIGTVTRG